MRVVSVAEYAFNAVKLAGITSVAVRGVDSVTVFTQHDKDPTDPLLDRTDPVFSRVFAITERLGIVATGMAADGRALVHEARNQAAEFRFKWGYEIPPRVLAQWIADRAQIRTQHAGMRPYGVVAMIFGIDGEKGTPELFTCDPAGICLGCKAASAGLKDSEAIKYLEEKMSGNPSLSFEATSEMAAFALRHVLGDINSLDIEVMFVFLPNTCICCSICALNITSKANVPGGIRREGGTSFKSFPAGCRAREASRMNRSHLCLLDVRFKSCSRPLSIITSWYLARSSQVWRITRSYG